MESHDDDDLPDADYRSIYGLAALHARDLRRLRATQQRLDALEHKADVTTARLKALLALPPPQTPRQALLAFVAQLSDADAAGLWKLFCSWYPPPPSP